jgi:hypothetical protein
MKAAEPHLFKFPDLPEEFFPIKAGIPCPKGRPSVFARGVFKVFCF